ncbi:MAG: S1C family serine protease, partial [Lachnospiraceae bacterium]
EYFYILTTKELTENGYLSIIFEDGTVTGGIYLTGDATTNLAVIAAAKSEFEKLSPERVHTAVLGNSYVVEQGDPLIVIGDIYEQQNMAVYTTAVSAQNFIMDTDTSYRYISTDIAASESDCGIIVNISGEVIGLIPYGKDVLSGKIVNGYGISELKRLIERLINGKVTPYVGIHPQTVTAAMKEAYGMPEGVYVDSVEADSPAYYAGIQSGDVIMAVSGETVATIRSFQSVIYTMEPGTEAVLSISRPGRDGYRDIEITVELGVE